MLQHSERLRSDRPAKVLSHMGMCMHTYAHTCTHTHVCTYTHTALCVRCVCACRSCLQRRTCWLSSRRRWPARRSPSSGDSSTRARRLQDRGTCLCACACACVYVYMCVGGRAQKWFRARGCLYVCAQERAGEEARRGLEPRRGGERGSRVCVSMFVGMLVQKHRRAWQHKCGRAWCCVNAWQHTCGRARCCCVSAWQHMCGRARCCCVNAWQHMCGRARCCCVNAWQHTCGRARCCCVMHGSTRVGMCGSVSMLLCRCCARVMCTHVVVHAQITFCLRRMGTQAVQHCTGGPPGLVLGQSTRQCLGLGLCWRGCPQTDPSRALPQAPPPHLPAPAALCRESIKKRLVLLQRASKEISAFM